jgi:hypothetical protein
MDSSTEARCAGTDARRAEALLAVLVLLGVVDCLRAAADVLDAGFLTAVAEILATLARGVAGKPVEGRETAAVDAVAGRLAPVVVGPLVGVDLTGDAVLVATGFVAGLAVMGTVEVLLEAEEVVAVAAGAGAEA